MKKIGISIFVLLWILVVVYVVRDSINDYKNQEPYICHLQDAYHCSYYVYPNFQDNYRFIKYLFDFANKHQGTINILTRESDVLLETEIIFKSEDTIDIKENKL